MASPTYYQSAGRILDEQLKNADGFDRQLAIAQACGLLAVVDSIDALRADMAALRAEVAEGRATNGQAAEALAEIKQVLSQIGMRLNS